MKYIVITPVYNEEKYLERYISSIVSQEVTPEALILVDDNSTDSSKPVIKSYSDKYEWITYLYHPSKNKKSQGAKVIRAFNYGLSKVSIEGIDFVSKIDADLELPKNYFSKILKAFQDNKIGLAGGYILERKENKWIRIPQASYHIRGALKSYRVDCLKQIDGLMPVLGWDGLDEMKAFYNGWDSKIIDIGVKHFRPASSDYNKSELYYKLGIANYKNGGNFFLAIIRSIIKLPKKPLFLLGVSYFKGYLHAYQNNKERNVCDDLAKFINRFHLKRLFFLKRY